MLQRIILASVVTLLIGGCSHSPQPRPMTITPNPSSMEGLASVHPAVSIARQQLGTPYHFGGASPERGFDCSGLVYYSFRHAGIKAPRTTATLFDSAFPVSGDSLRQGDLLFFRIEGKVSHVGIYIGGDTFLHAPSTGKTVSYASLTEPYWQQRLIRAGRLF